MLSMFCYLCFSSFSVPNLASAFSEPEAGFDGSMDGVGDLGAHKTARAVAGP